MRSLLLERLEDRRVLDGHGLSLESVAALFASDNISVTGATIITHGFQPSNKGGDSLLPLAAEVVKRASGDDKTAWLLDYDIRGEGKAGFFDADLAEQDDGVGNGSILPSKDVGGTGELVLLFDWAPESQELSSGWTEAAGDAIFTILIDLGLVNPEAVGESSIPLHFIGHSFGAAVTSEAVERLAAYNVPVDHITYLDPHDFDQLLVPVDGAQEQFTVGQPQPGYGATVWDNVAFADVYYQTFGIDTFPEGRPIPGAYNRLVTSDDVSIVGVAHSQVWEEFYLSTIEDVFAVEGYSFSRIGSNNRPLPNFYSQHQDHAHTPHTTRLQGPCRFSIQGFDPNGLLENYSELQDLGLLESNLNAAAGVVQELLPVNARGTIDVLVSFDDGKFTANAGAAPGDWQVNSQLSAAGNQLAVLEPVSAIEMRTGVDANEVAPDINLYLNAAWVANSVWFDPANGADSDTTSVPDQRFDFITVVIHELLHGLGVAGFAKKSAEEYGDLPTASDVGLGGVSADTLVLSTFDSLIGNPLPEIPSGAICLIRRFMRRFDLHSHTSCGEFAGEYHFGTLTSYLLPLTRDHSRQSREAIGRGGHRQYSTSSPLA